LGHGRDGGERVSVCCLNADIAVRMIAPQIVLRTKSGRGNPNSNDSSYVTSVLTGLSDIGVKM